MSSKKPKFTKISQKYNSEDSYLSRSSDSLLNTSNCMVPAPTMDRVAIKDIK